MFKSLPAISPQPGHGDKSHHSFLTGATSSPLETNSVDPSLGSVTTNASNASTRQTGVYDDNE